MNLNIAAIIGSLSHIDSASIRYLWSVVSLQFNFPCFAPQPYAPYFVSHTIYFHVYKKLINTQRMAEEDVQNNITAVTWHEKEIPCNTSGHHCFYIHITILHKIHVRYCLTRKNHTTMPVVSKLRVK